MYGAEAFIYWVFLVAIGFIILYFVIKAAIINALRESGITRKEDVYHKVNNAQMHSADGVHIAKTICPSCHKRHDIDYPKCPHCGHIYQKL